MSHSFKFHNTSVVEPSEMVMSIDCKSELKADTNVSLLRRKTLYLTKTSVSHFKNLKIIVECTDNTNVNTCEHLCTCTMY